MSNKNFVKVVGIGMYEINMTLTLSEEDAKKYGIPDISKLESLKDCKSFLTLASEKNSEEVIKEDTILDHFVLTTSNSAINTLLFINRSFKNKTFIEYLTLSQCVFKEEEKFLYELIKYVTEQNYLFVIENKILNIKSKFKFTFNIGNQHSVLELESEGADIEDKKESSLELYDQLNYEFDGTNYFFADINELISYNKYDLNFSDFSKFIKTILVRNQDIQIVLNFPEKIPNESGLNENYLEIISDLFALTDIFIFDRRSASNLISSIINKNSRNPIKSNNDEEAEILFIRDVKKLRTKSPKVGLFFDEFKKLSIIEQQPKSDLVLFHSDFDFDLIPNIIPKNIQEEYKKILSTNHETLKAIFLGGFFSRFFNSKSFNTSFKAGNESLKRILELMKLDFEFPADPNFFLVSIKKPNYKSKKIEVQENEMKEKERHFILDCMNLQNSKLKNYNPLYDQSLHSFFSTQQIFKHLKKLGFIDKQGNILQDPDTKRVGIGNNRKFLKTIEFEKKKLMNLSENTHMMKFQMKQILEIDKKNLHCTKSEQLEKFLKLDNFKKISNKKIAFKLKSKSYYPNSDLYDKEIKEKTEKHSKTSRIKNLKPISANNYKKLLDNYECNLKSKDMQQTKKCEDLEKGPK